MTTTSDRKYQLQGSYTRYLDNLHEGYDTINGCSKHRNFKTLKSAIRAAKRELVNDLEHKVVRTEDYYETIDGDTYKFHRLYGEDGRVLKDKYEFWHTDSVRIIDRDTLKVLWEEQAAC